MSLFLLSLTLFSTACSQFDINAPFDFSLLTPTQTAAPPRQFTTGLVSISEGLDQLDSYRINLIVDFEGTRSGQPSAGHVESLTEINRPAAALHQYLNVEATLPDTEPGISEFFRLKDKIYVSTTKESKQFEVPAGSRISPGTMGFFELEKLIVLPATVSTPPRPETLNGIPTQRYSFTQNNLSAPNIIFEQAQGELWVAQTDNYLVQYVISATLKIPNPIPNAHLLDEGRLTLSYTLTDVNAEVTIAPPNIATVSTTPLADFPLPPESQITAIYPTLIEYTSVISPISATHFYQTGLLANGWTEEQAEIYEEKSRLIFSKESETLTITIVPADEPKKIRVSLSIDTRP